MPLDPQCRMLLDQMAAMGGPALEDQTPEQARAMFAAFGALAVRPDVARVEDRQADGVPVRVYMPEAGQDPRPVLVYLHGGGFVIGDLESHDGVCRELANASGALVVAVDYRLSPEHPYPSPLDDALTALRWVRANAAEFGGDPDRLAVGGDSAGGNLASLTALAARDEGLPLRLQLLVYPVIDLTMSQPSITENAEGYLLTAASLKWFYGHYLGTADPKDPRCSPLFVDDLHGVAPARVITAEFDPLRDEGEAYAERLKEAGVPVTATRYPGMIHGFFQMGAVLDAGATAVAEAAGALRDAFT